MDKRYQVFISSTYTDLEKERKGVYQAIMEMDCIPAGMELFPAMDEDQFEFIKKIIDDSDYYILIIGGRYGTPTADGVSYTEKEYDYAVAKGIKVIALVHGEPQSIPQGRAESTDEGRGKLDKFRQKVAAGRLVRFWTKTEEIPGHVLGSLQRTIKTYPAVGWVRADKAASVELLSQINEIRIENEALRREILESKRNTIPIKNLAWGKELTKVQYKSWDYSYNELFTNTVQISWDDLFALTAPMMIARKPAGEVNSLLGAALDDKYGRKLGDSYSVTQYDFDTIMLQFHSVGHVELSEFAVSAGSTTLSAKLTDTGMAYLASLRAVRSAKAPSDVSAVCL